MRDKRRMRLRLAAALIPNALDAKLIKAVEGCEEVDTFPTYSRADSVSQIRRVASKTCFEIERVDYLNNCRYLLMFSPLLCRLVIGYDKLIQSFLRLRCLQCWLEGMLQRAKPRETKVTSVGDAPKPVRRVLYHHRTRGACR